MSTTSGCSEETSATASTPFTASPATAMPGSWASSSRSAARMSVWSSTMSTEVIAVAPSR